MLYALDPPQMKTLMRVALGQEKADLVIERGDLVNVYSGEVIRSQSVAVKDKWIAYVGPDAGHCLGEETRRIDATGKVLIPGLIDAHSHMLFYCAPDEFLRYGMRGGTTMLVTELAGAIMSHSYQGLMELLDALQDQPIKVFFTVSPSITMSETSRQRAPNLEQLVALLEREDAVGVGEGFWQDVLRGEPNFAALAAHALKIRKSVEGHAAGCRSEKLAAYLNHGVSSCHESVNIEEVLEKLRLGICVMIREGSGRKELEAIAGIKDRPIDFRRLALVSDSIDLKYLMEKGYMETIVQRAIDLGFDPIVAIQMATINPAQHFHLDDVLGGIAPGKYADIVVIPDLRTIDAEYVVSNGQIISHHKELAVKPRKARLSLGSTRDLRVSESDFKIPAVGTGPVKVRIIDQVTDVVTREAIVELLPTNGELRADPAQDILKVSLITWDGKFYKGFIRGMGMKRGAMATSYAWQAFGVTVVAASDDDMVLAMNRVAELGGGMVVCAGGQILGELPLPVAGMISDLPIEEVVSRLDRIRTQAQELGFRYTDALRTLGTLTTPAIPFVRITEDGLVDLKNGQVVGFYA